MIRIGEHIKKEPCLIKLSEVPAGCIVEFDDETLDSRYFYVFDFVDYDNIVHTALLDLKNSSLCSLKGYGHIMVKVLEPDDALEVTIQTDEHAFYESEKIRQKNRKSDSMLS